VCDRKDGVTGKFACEHLRLMMGAAVTSTFRRETRRVVVDLVQEAGSEMKGL